MCSLIVFVTNKPGKIKINQRYYRGQQLWSNSDLVNVYPMHINFPSSDQQSINPNFDSVASFDGTYLMSMELPTAKEKLPNMV